MEEVLVGGPDTLIVLFSDLRNQDDCMVEIFFDSKKDSIGMEMTCQRRIMTESEARELAEAWAREVRDAFSS